MSDGNACPIPDRKAPLTPADVHEQVVKSIIAEGQPLTSRNIIFALCALVARHCRGRPEGYFGEHVSGHVGHHGSL